MKSEEILNMEHTWPYHGSKLIPKDQLKPFLKRDNISGLKHLFLHLSLIVISGSLIYVSPNLILKILLMFMHGSFIAFLYAGLHECIHKTAFKNRKLNEYIGYFLGFILLRSFLNGRYRHMAHHTYTQLDGKDPDKVEFPDSYSDYLKHVTSFAIWIRIIGNLVRHSLGKINSSEKEYIPDSEINSLIKETRFMMLGYFLIIGISIYLNTTFFLIYWLLPRVMGEPFVRLVRMVEHTGKEETADMIHNTRTSFPSVLLKFLYWNMPYHIEHHLYSNVPFYKLPKFHQLVKPHTNEMEPSILSVHIQILKEIWKNKKNKKKNTLLSL
jgi:fatty acid desaturase